MFDLASYLAEKRLRIEAALDERLPPETTPPEVLHRAMRYSVFAGGKRTRPVLCMAAAEAVGAADEKALIPAVAIEVLHTYTLIHDDLPCMDNSDLRRGKPSCHTVFGEANALLAGDALLTIAFEWLAAAIVPAPYPPGQLALELAVAAGSLGIVAGQVEDMAAEGKAPSAELVERIHLRKTAMLFRGAMRMGGMAGGASASELEMLSGYGRSIGLAFQITDDLLGASSTSESAGKPTGLDEKKKKMTSVYVHGEAGSRNMAARLIEEAASLARQLHGEVRPLIAIAQQVLTRTH